MPMYYFRVEDDGVAAEPQGLRLNDLAAARSHARMLDDAIRSRARDPRAQWAILVTGEDGLVVCEIRHGH